MYLSGTDELARKLSALANASLKELSILEQEVFEFLDKLAAINSTPTLDSVSKLTSEK